LVAAAERVRGGDLAARVPAGDSDEEFSSLSRAFNRMTHQLQSQQSELIEANRQLDQRRRFTETVLSGVSAGVIGLDQQGRINLPNRSASLLLGSDLDQHIGKDLAGVVPEMAGLYDEAERRPDRLAQAQVAERSLAAAAESLRLSHADAGRLGAAPLLAEIEALARRTRIDLRPPRRLPAGAAGVGADLTAREREILGHLAAGRTNGEIAKALVISTKTASVHVSNILRKLEVPSRYEAAEIAERYLVDEWQVGKS